MKENSYHWWWKIIGLAVVIFIFLMSYQKVFAENQKQGTNQESEQPTVIITEVFPAPEDSSDDQSEWIEIFNRSDQTVDLTEWELLDQLSSPSQIYQFEAVNLESGQFKVIKLPTAKLNNSGDGVSLVDNNGSTIDEMSYQSSQTGTSWSLDVENMTWVLSQPSPGTSNILPSPSPSPSPAPTPTPSPTATPTPSSQATTLLELSEIYACPNSDEDEWIEVYNSAPTAVTIDNFYLQDASGNKKSFDHLVVNAQSLAVITWSSSFLNNSGDSVALIDQNQTEHFNVTYSQCQKGKSYIYHDGSWQITTIPTKNTTNTYVSTETEEEEAAIEDQPVTTSSQPNQKQNQVSISNITSLNANQNTLPMATSSAIVLGDFIDQEATTLPQDTTPLFNFQEKDHYQRNIFVSFMLSGLHLVTGGAILIWQNFDQIKI